MLNVPLRPNKTELLFMDWYGGKLNGVGGDWCTRNPDEADRGQQWIRVQPMPIHQVNDIEFENPATIHVYDMDEDRALETCDLIGAWSVAARQVTICDVFVSYSGIDLGYVKKSDPELMEYTRYQMTPYFITRGTPLV